MSQVEDHLCKSFEAVSLQAKKSAKTVDDLHKIATTKDVHIAKRISSLEEELKASKAENER